jgi:UDP-4-amino-4-deoxy-L-arabinose-oxoglutarate aminotransferase
LKKIEFFRHGIGEEELQRLREVLGSLFITTGKAVYEFEDDFARYLGLPHTVAVTSCTSAMQLALLAGGVKPGDEVITSTMTFIGTPNAVLMAGATPVLVDVDRSTGNISPEEVEAAVTERTKAIMPVHLYGQMCDMDALRAVADRHGLFIVEDAAHAIEGKWNGKAPGHYGEYATFSFYATKNITSGEGGAVTVRDEKQYELMNMLRLHGFNQLAVDRYTSNYEKYDIEMFGWKYNMDSLHAAILIEQLKKIGEFGRRRREIFDRYTEAFSETDGIELHTIRPEAEHAYHLLTILVEPARRDAVMDGLQERGVGVSINFIPVHQMTYYRERFGYRDGMFPAAEEIGARTISLPLYPKLTDEELEYVIDAVRKTVASS